MYIKYSQLDTYWYIENSLDFCICKCLNSDSSRVMNLGILWVPLHRVPSPSKIAAEERLTENHHRQGLWWAYGTSNSNQKKEPGFRVVDGLWYIDICHFLSANRLLTKSVHRVNPPVSKSGDGKKREGLKTRIHCRDNMSIFFKYCSMLWTAQEFELQSFTQRRYALSSCQ